MWLGLGLLLLLMIELLWLPAREQHTYPSSYSTDSGGAKAAYELLSASHFQEKRWLRSPRSLPPGRGVTLILASPMFASQASRADRAALGRFVRSGGRILATGAGVSALFPADAGTPVKRLTKHSYRALLPGRLAAKALSISMRPRRTWSEADPALLALYGRRGRTVVAFAPPGRHAGAGSIMFWASSFPLTNAGIRQPASLELLFHSLGSRPRLVLWDEYFHGVRRGWAHYLAIGALPWAALPLLVLLAAALWTYSRRFGPLLPATAADRYSPLEFVAGVAGMYERAQAGDAAVAIARAALHGAGTHMAASAMEHALPRRRSRAHEAAMLEEYRRLRLAAAEPLGRRAQPPPG